VSDHGALRKVRTSAGIRSARLIQSSKTGRHTRPLSVFAKWADEHSRTRLSGVLRLRRPSPPEART
jgi:hypothetical protein